ncbi:MAG: hypothetical protein DRP88_07180 [Candidatus Neomarinimicrobiota bacterium]|nr:MAG: hypothetical protein DRP88_07180 [Candidatus Neomarinimicrobiota bacterium]
MREISVVERLVKKKLGELLNSKKVFYFAVNNDDFVSSLLRDKTFREKAVNNDDFVSSLLRDIGFYRRIRKYDIFLRNVVNDEWICMNILKDRVFIKTLLNSGLTSLLVELYVYLERLRKIADEDKIRNYDTEGIIQLAIEKGSLKDAFLDIISDGNTIYLKHGVMEFPDRKAIWTLLNEILVSEDYYFETNIDAPLILDCGTHIGLAIYYFKSLYPRSKIIGFEPNPVLRDLADKNIKRNGYKDVEIYEYALSKSNKRCFFWISETDSMAGSLTRRRKNTGDKVYRIKVQSRKLSEFLGRPVNFLKVDIEGMEFEVLNEAKEYLRNVEYIFCEYHNDKYIGGKKLGKIIKLLYDLNFDVQIDRSFYFSEYMRFRPMKKIGEPYSVCIWARNKNWASK